MRRFTPSPLRALALLVAAAAGIACSDTVQDPIIPASPLAGLQRGATNDSAPSAGPSTTATSGAIHGTVRGPTVAGSGPDTLAAAPKIANVKVTAYTQVSSSGGLIAGEQVGTTTTNANGEFALPTLPAGNYLVTFIPPVGSKYNGQYTPGVVDSRTNLYPWYIMLTVR